MQKEGFKSLIYGAASGLLLAIPQNWFIFAPIQLVALLPVLYLAAKKEANYRQMFYAGLSMGIFYLLPQAYVLQFPLLMSLILSFEWIFIFSAFIILSHRLLRRQIVFSAFAVGALFVLLDWINFTAVPFWGIAQTVVRPWSAYPKFISFICITGLTGIAFLIVTLQSLIVNIIVYPGRKIRFVSTAAILVLVFITANIVLQSGKAVDRIKVSAIGWPEDSNRISYPDDANSLFARLVEKAAQEGSKIVVSPEMGFIDNSEENSQWFENFMKIARKNNIFLVTGVFSQNLSKAFIYGPDGQTLGEYTKTHLTPLDKYEKGDGKLFNFSINGINTGIMICNDDNFTDFSRSYGRKQTALVVVPTWDWQPVKNAHFQSSINRAIESNYAVIRACYNGISAIISPRGEIMKKMDHLKEGSGIITADVPLYSGVTLFSLLGHWSIVPCFILLLIYIVKEIKSGVSSVNHTKGLNT